MIYNLRSYLLSLYPTEKIYVNVRDNTFPDTSIPDRYISLYETGGNINDYPNDNLKNPYDFQVIVQDIDSPKSRKLIYQIFDSLDKNFSITLPAVNVAGDVFASKIIKQMSANAIPVCLGYDTEGRCQWSCNFRAYFE